MEKKYKTNRYFWLKLQDNFFKSQDIKVLETQANGAKYILFWLKLLLLAIQQEVLGVLRFKEDIPYTPEILASVTETDIDTVRISLPLFQRFGMIEVQENGDIMIESVLKMVGSESESAQRVRNFRAKKKKIEDKKPVMKALQCNVETDTDLELELEKENNNKPSVSCSYFDKFKKEYNEEIPKDLIKKIGIEKVNKCIYQMMEVQEITRADIDTTAKGYLRTICKNHETVEEIPDKPVQKKHPITDGEREVLREQDRRLNSLWKLEIKYKDCPEVLIYIKEFLTVVAQGISDKENEIMKTELNRLIKESEGKPAEG